MTQRNSPARKLELAERRERQLASVPTYPGSNLTGKDRAEAWERATKKSPAGPYGDSRVSLKNRRAMLRYMLKHKRQELLADNGTMVIAINAGAYY